MFSSLATFLFGAQPTSTEPTNSEANPVQVDTSNNVNANANEQTAEVGDVIEVTSSTPSIAGNNSGSVRATQGNGSANGNGNGNGNGKRAGGKNKRGRQRQQQQQQQQQQTGQRKQATITKLLTSSSEGGVLDVEINEDEWYIVEKEDDDSDSLPRSDSEAELSPVEASPKSGRRSAARRRHPHITLHSLRHTPTEQQRLFLQRQRATRMLSISTLNTPRSAPDSNDDDTAVSQSLYAAPTAAAVSPCGSDTSTSSSDKGNNSGVVVEDSWYVTPPPCFTSIGPINMEASPFENLLIEHPSMSVYHSIRSSQADADSFLNLDLGAGAANSGNEPETLEDILEGIFEVQAQDEPVAVQQQRTYGARYDRHAAAQLKQQSLARQSQKSNSKKQHQQLCRSALKRANKVREFQSKGQRSRRSDMQHCKLASGANNNRKCC